MKKLINIPGMATVIAKEGFHMIQLPSGELLPGVLKTVVTDEVDEIPKAVVTIMVNIEVKKNEILESFKKAKSAQYVLSNVDPDRKGLRYPFRVGKKQQRAVLDANGVEVVIFPVGMSKMAHLMCKLYNDNFEFIEKNRAFQYPIKPLSSEEILKKYFELNPKTEIKP